MKKIILIMASLILIFMTLSFDLIAQDMIYSKIVIYRKRGIGNPQFSLFLNDHKIDNSFSRKNYWIIDCPAGKVIIKVLGRTPFTEDREFSLMVEPGQTYYLEGFDNYEFLTTSLYLTKREKDIAEKELAKRQGQYVSLLEVKP